MQIIAKMQIANRAFPAQLAHASGWCPATCQSQGLSAAYQPEALARKSFIGKTLRGVILLLFVRAEKRDDPTGHFLGLLGAIIKRDAMISVAAQKKAGISLGPILDPGDQLQMS